MTNTSGTIQAQYGYDPFGQVTKISETVPSDFGYAGYYLHARSGLNLTQTRAYSSAQGRFINRDPIEEEGGVNLFAYTENNPSNSIDPSGTYSFPIIEPPVGIIDPILVPIPGGGILRNPYTFPGDWIREYDFPEQNKCNLRNCIDDAKAKYEKSKKTAQDQATLTRDIEKCRNRWGIFKRWRNKQNPNWFWNPGTNFPYTPYEA